MKIIDDVTLSYSIPIPNNSNNVQDDMNRLREAFARIDDVLKSKADASDLLTRESVTNLVKEILTENIGDISDFRSGFEG